MISAFVWRLQEAISEKGNSLAMTVHSTPEKAQVAPRSRLSAIVLGGLLLGVPAATVPLRAYGSAGEPRPLQVAARQASDTPNLPVLEEKARTAPTVENRLNLSVGYINARAPAEAISVLTLLIAEDANNAIAWNNLCAAHNMQRDYTRGIAACTEALRIDPRFQLAADNLKWAMDEQAKEEKTGSFPPKPVGVGDASRQASFFLDQGLHQLNTGDYDAAIASWQKVLALDPANALAANNIGTAYMFKKEPGTALEWFRRSVASDPSLQIARNNLGWAAGEVRKTGR